MKSFKIILCRRKRSLLIGLLSGICSIVAAQTPGPVESATSTIQRLIGGRISDVSIKLIPIENKLDTFTYEALGGKVTVSGNTGVAICRGFYDYLKKNHLCQVSWSGNRIDLTGAFPDAALTTGSTPYQNRYYLNVVTYGYSTPYWDWARWQQEIDWMAFHGINMPLMLIGVEAIGTRMWENLGFTKAEIDAFLTGPAHLPWQRMGNIYGVDSPYPASWNTDQLALAHQVLDQMRGLGMKPIVQGFSGFVPKAFKRVYPTETISEMNWGGFPAANHGYLLSPYSNRFDSIQKAYIGEWEKEFGSCDYYLIDSFNEMELPNTGQPDSVLLADYGSKLYKSLALAKPGAKWVIQGWTFGYMRSTWTKPNMRGLLKNVPNDSLFILDEAEDYNMTFWNNGSNWEYYNAFDKKEWGWGVIPNMGGKTAYTGVMSFYATEPFRVLNSPSKGRLTGFGLFMEGIENNDVLYELLSDVSWKKTSFSLNNWVQDYCKARYGSCPSAMTRAWALLQQTAYGSFTDHPRFGWQTMSSTGGTVNKSSAFFQAVDSFLVCSDAMECNPLYKADAVELTSICLGLKADEYYAQAVTAHTAGNIAVRDTAIARTLRTLTDMDKLLESHPLNRLDRWLNFARSHGTDAAQKQYYESNARKIVTTWGSSSVWDYSARMWSGLIRDYYRGRLSAYFNSLKTNTTFNRSTWEANWVAGTGVSAVTPFEDPCQAAKSLFKQYNLSPNFGIAYHMPVTATSSESGRLASYITDGSTTGNYWSANPAPQSVTIDLSATANIDSIRVFPYVDGTRYYQFSVWVSSDNKNWTMVGDFTKNTTPSTAAGTACTISPATTARYVKVTMTKNSANTSVHLHEVRVFGKLLTSPYERLGISYQKPATATSSESGHMPSVITDGTTTGDYWAAGPAPQSVEIDLESMAKVDSIFVYPYVDGTRYYQYTVWTSPDEVNWTLAGDYSKNTTPSTTAGTKCTITPAADVRYVKVTMTKNSANPSVHLHEVRVFGKFSSGTTEVNPVSIIPSITICSNKKNICIGLNDSKAKAWVYGVDGKVILQKDIKNGNNKLLINASPGVYVAKVISDRAVVSKQVVIE